MADSSDWYPKTLDGERAMFGNIDSKIDGYVGKYPVLDVGYLQEIHTMCQAFVGAYDKVIENRATARQMTSWFDSIVRSKQENQAVPRRAGFSGDCHAVRGNDWFGTIVPDVCAVDEKPVELQRCRRA